MPVVLVSWWSTKLKTFFFLSLRNLKNMWVMIIQEKNAIVRILSVVKWKYSPRRGWNYRYHYCLMYQGDKAVAYDFGDSMIALKCRSFAFFCSTVSWCVDFWVQTFYLMCSFAYYYISYIQKGSGPSLMLLSIWLRRISFLEASQGHSFGLKWMTWVPLVTVEAWKEKSGILDLYCDRRLCLQGRGLKRVAVR